MPNVAVIAYLNELPIIATSFDLFTDNVAYF